MTLKVLAAKLDMMIAEAAGPCEYVTVLRLAGDDGSKIWVASNIPPKAGAILLISAAATMGPDMIKVPIYGKGH